MQKRSISDSSNGSNTGAGYFKWLLATLVLVLLILFGKALLPNHVVFSNDGPLGAVKASAMKMPSAFFSVWHDLNSIGQNSGSFLLPFTGGLLWLAGPEGFSKLYAPMSVLILGLAAGFFFRQLRLSPAACVLGGLAAALGSGPFSTACWGMGAHPLAIGTTYLAMGAVVSDPKRLNWVHLALAGLAVGVGVMEAADVGALLSMFLAGFVLFYSLLQEGPIQKRLAWGVARVAVIAILACLIAAQTVTTLVSTQIKGVAGTEQTSQTKAERWDWATQWSLPKRETLGLFVPGLFGYRMDTPNGLPEWMEKSFRGGHYWGAMGRDPAWDRYFASGKQGSPPQGFMRFSGGGAYAGVLVVLLGFWAAFQAFRKQSVFETGDKRFLRFWVIIGIVALLLAFGRFAPFYQIIYKLPYFSTIRNPAKFLHFFNFAIVVLFAYGVHGLCRAYLNTPLTSSAGIVSRFQAWWKRAAAFDRRWIIGCAVALALSVVGWMIYSSSSDSLITHLQEVQFDEGLATEIASFSIRSVGWFILFFLCGIATIALILSGTFSGARANIGIAILGLVLVTDLTRANLPWVIIWNYKVKYATNPIIDTLREQPYEHRVAVLPFRFPPELPPFDQLYRIEWAQHHFLYYDVQSLDIIQMPRMPQNLLAFKTALAFRGTPESVRLMTREWELTNTRYLLGPVGYLETLNEQVDPLLKRFRVLKRFHVAAKPGVYNPRKLEELEARPADDGAFAIFEFSGALPRAKLFTHWRVPGNDPKEFANLTDNDISLLNLSGTNDFLTVKTLASAEFNPAHTVLLSDPIPHAPPTNAPAQPGTVEFTRYAPKHIELKTQSDTAAVLLLSDKFDPEWEVLVDGKSQPLLRANYIMRGVYLEPGTHTVQFHFAPVSRPLYVSLSAMALGVGLLGFVVIPRRTRTVPQPDVAQETPEKPRPGRKAPKAA